MVERGIAVGYESISLWCIKIGSKFAKRLRRRHQGYGDIFFIDKVFVKIQGKQHCLWRAVDQDGEEVDVFLQARRDGKAATRFFKRLLKAHGGESRKMVARGGTTDTRIFSPMFVGFWPYISISYRGARRPICTTMHDNAQLSHAKLPHLFS